MNTGFAGVCRNRQSLQELREVERSLWQIVAKKGCQWQRNGTSGQPSTPAAGPSVAAMPGGGLCGNQILQTPLSGFDVAAMPGGGLCANRCPPAMACDDEILPLQERIDR